MLDCLLLFVAASAMTAGVWLVATTPPAPLANEPKAGESWRPVIGATIVILTSIVIFAQAEVLLP
jgi:hypothetical protein